MPESRYITLSVPREAHGRLKQLAGSARMPLSRYLAAMVHFFSATGRHPEVLEPVQEHKELLQLKKRLEQVVRLLKGQEKQVFAPMADAIVSLERYVLAGEPSENSPSVSHTVLCPQCSTPFSRFVEETGKRRCPGCGLFIGTHIGKEALTLSDQVCLLSGGMTRIFENVKLGKGPAQSGRFLLDSASSYRLVFHKNTPS